MTALRPEREGTDLYGAEGADGRRSGGYPPYQDESQFAAAVDQLDDPLTDPLPGQGPLPAPGVAGQPSAVPPGPTAQPYSQASTPVYAHPRAPGPGQVHGSPHAHAHPQRDHSGAVQGFDAAPAAPAEPQHQPEQQGRPQPPLDDTGAWFRPQPPSAGAAPSTPTGAPASRPPLGPPPPGEPAPVATDGHGRPFEPKAQPYTGYHDASAPVSPPVRERHEPVPAPDPDAAPLASAGVAAEPKTRAEPSSDPAAQPTEGRAARRRAAQEEARRQRRGGSRARRGKGTATAAGAASAAGASAAEAPAAPTSRVEARKAARAARDSPSVIASRLLGEGFISLGVLMLLFVAYQLWWTNVLAQQAASGAAKNLEQEWSESGEQRAPGAFEPGQGFAIMYIPKLDVKVPIAEGIDKHKVLDQGMLGHYDGELETAMPWDKKGNFAVAGHRNTHGEPFRYINKLQPGDAIIVETASKYYTYEMASILPQTPPSNISVIEPVPVGSGFSKPGRYITLTTCTPEFTSKFRMIVWGKMAEERPRSEGKPDALVG